MLPLDCTCVQFNELQSQAIQQAACLSIQLLQALTTVFPETLWCIQSSRAQKVMNVPCLVSARTRTDLQGNMLKNVFISMDRKKLVLILQLLDEVWNSVHRVLWMCRCALWPRSAARERWRIPRRVAGANPAQADVQDCLRSREHQNWR